MEELSFPMKLLRMLYPFNPPQYHLFYDLLALLFAGCFFDFKRIRTLRNLDILMLCVWVPMGYYEVAPKTPFLFLGWLPLLYFLPRLVYQVYRKSSDRCVINYSPRTLITLTALLLLFSCVMTFAYSFPFGNHSLSDSAEGGMAAARAMLDGRTPYGTLKYGWDTYPPVYYYAYVAVELLFSDGKPVTNHWEPGSTYGAPARALTCLLHVTAIVALSWLGRRLRDKQFGYALSFAWMALPYPLISAAQSQTGHMMPGVLSVLALLGISLSITAGAVMLAILAAGAFYPVIFVPVWSSWVAGKAGGKAGLRFLLVAGAVGLFLWLPLFPMGRGPIRGLETFLDATIANNVSYIRYSPFYHHEWMMPVRTFFGVLFLPFVGFATWAAWRNRGGFIALASLTGAIVVAEQLFHVHTPGRYHNWMIPLFLPVLLLGQTRARFEEPSE